MSQKRSWSRSGVKAAGTAGANTLLTGVLLLPLLLSTGIGCDGGDGDGGPSDGAVAPDGGDAADVPVIPDAATAMGKTGLALPPGVAPPRRILPAAAALSGASETKCSHQQPASGDGTRWCAFTMPGVSQTVVELWVIDVTAASTGAVPPCDGSSPKCMRLSTTVETRSANAFRGDTLIFFSDRKSFSTDPFIGSISAWRPGWTKPRRLASDAGLLCEGHRNSGAALCLDEAEGAIRRDRNALRVGVLSNENDGHLPILTDGLEPLFVDRSRPWMGSFSPNGEWFAISAPDATGVPVLKVVATDSIGKNTPVEIVRDLNDWTIAGDNQKVYFTRQTPTGTSGLFIADFPSGANPVMLNAQVRDYNLVGSGAGQTVSILSKVDKISTFQLLRDRTKADTALTVFRTDAFLEGIRVSPDLRYTAWLDESFRARVVKHDDVSTCQINTDDERSVFDPTFLGNGELMFWTERSDTGQAEMDGYFAPPSDCRAKQLLARRFDFVRPIASRGIVLGDERDHHDTVTLKYAATAQAATGWAPAPPVRIQEHAHVPITFVGADTLLLVYQVLTSDGKPDGIYVFGPVPF